MPGEQPSPGFPSPHGGSLRKPGELIGMQRRSQADTDRRLATLERFLQGFNERQIQHVDADGRVRTTTVLMKASSGTTASDNATTTIQFKEFITRDNKRYITFYPAKFVSHTLVALGVSHDIAVPSGGGTLSMDPPVEIPFDGSTKFYIEFQITPSGDVTGVQLLTSQKTQKEVIPIRPSVTTQSGLYSYLLGSIAMVDNTPVWHPSNCDATVGCFIPAIESVGDGERLYSTYSGGTDQWRSIRGQNEAEQEESDYNAIRDEFSSASSGFEVRELPVRLEFFVRNETIIGKGFVLIPIPDGESGGASWKNCGSAQAGVQLNLNRGIAVLGTQLGDYLACPCGQCTSTQVDGPTS